MWLWDLNWYSCFVVVVCVLTVFHGDPSTGECCSPLLITASLGGMTILANMHLVQQMFHSINLYSIRVTFRRGDSKCGKGLEELGLSKVVSCSSGNCFWIGL